MELISFLGKLFGYTPEIANVISGELRSVSEARRRPKLLQKLHIRKFMDVFRQIKEKYPYFFAHSKKMLYLCSAKL